MEDSSRGIEIETGGRPGAATSGTPGVNLLVVPRVRGLFLWPAFPYVLQAMLLVAVVALAAAGWGLHTPKGVADKLYAKTNVVNLAVWGLFWPAMVWITVLFGRVWCMVCPVELVSNAAERAGRALGIPQLSLGAWLRAGWLILAGYALLQLLVTGVHLHRVPHYTSIFFLALLALATATGLAFRDRVFCRAFCPIAHLLRVYGRGGVLAVRPAGTEACGDCREKGCAASATRRRLDARGCPSLLNPARLNESTDCLICGQCFKTCGHDNMGLYLRRPFHAADRRETLPSWPVVLFVMVVSGFVCSEVASEWAAARNLYAKPVDAMVRALGAKGAAGWVEGLWTVVLLPALLWLAMAAGIRLAGGARSLVEAWRRLALPLAVVIAAGQMAKGLAKFVSWAGFLPMALAEPDGVRAALAMAAKRMPQPAALLPMPAVSVAGLLLMVWALYVSVREARLVDPGVGFSRLWPHYALSGAFAFTIFGWGFLR